MWKTQQNVIVTLPLTKVLVKRKCRDLMNTEFHSPGPLQGRTSCQHLQGFPQLQKAPWPRPHPAHAGPGPMTD